MYVKNWSSYNEYGKVLCTDANWMLTNAKLATTNARSKAIERVNLETQNSSKTELEVLTANWKKTTDQINHLTASWATSFIDNLAAATTGGQAQWRKMLADMAMQVYKVFLQKQFADPLVFGLTWPLFGLAGAISFMVAARHRARMRLRSTLLP